MPTEARLQADVDSLRLRAHATSARLASWGSLGVAAVLLWVTCGTIATPHLLAWLLLALLRRLPGSGQVGWRYGLANLARRRALSITQMVALASGLMALLILTVVHGDLLAAWQRNVPADAPNRFVINIQPPQREPVRELLRSQGLPAPELAPMVRARLLSINDRQVRPEQYPDERAQRWLLSVSASDRSGLLYGIARVLARHGINLQLAKVSTLGERVEDTFLVNGPALQQTRAQLQIESELLDALAPVR